MARHIPDAAPKRDELLGRQIWIKKIIGEAPYRREASYRCAAMGIRTRGIIHEPVPLRHLAQGPGLPVVKLGKSSLHAQRHMGSRDHPDPESALCAYAFSPRDSAPGPAPSRLIAPWCGEYRALSQGQGARLAHSHCCQ